METELWYKEEDHSGNVWGKEVGENLYQLIESALFFEGLLFGTTVKAKLKDDGKIWIDEIVKQASFRTEIRILSKDFIESQDFQTLTEKLIKIGGAWDQSMGGVICFYIPLNSDFEIK